MGLLQNIKDLVGRDHAMRRRGEADAPTDPAHGTRETGGVPDPTTMDQNSSTGTTPNQSYVGRAGGDETGDTGISGAEGRAGGEVGGHTGAARDS